jgi:hypothetical protein
MVASTQPPQARAWPLPDVLALIGKVSCRRDSWRATLAEWRFLAEVSAATGQCLPAEALTSASVTLCFLVLARFGLEKRERALGDAVTG